MEFRGQVPVLFTPAEILEMTSLFGRVESSMLIAELSLFDIISNATYGALAAVALWGIYCIVAVWTRVSQKRFKTEEEQDAFMDDVEQIIR